MENIREKLKAAFQKVKEKLIPILKNKKIVIPVAAVLGCMCIAYGAGWYYYSNHFFPETYINGISCGNQSMAYIEEQLVIPYSDSISVIGKDGEVAQIALQDLEYTLLFDSQQLSAIRGSQKPYAWIGGLWGQKEYSVELSVSYDEDRLDGLLQELHLVSGDHIVKPSDAYIDREQAYEIIPEVEGNTLDYPSFREAVVMTIASNADSLDLAVEDCYVYPKVYSDHPEFVAVSQKLAPLRELKLTYDYGDREEIVDYATFGSWIDLDNPEGKIVFNEEMVYKYVEQMAQKYDTLYTERKFQSTDSGIISISGGIYGWRTDVNGTYQKLLDALNAGVSTELTPSYWTVARDRGSNDIGNTYVEIDLTAQQMWYYIDGKLHVETGIVSGLPTWERETPTGVFYVWSKETKRYLTGDDYELWVEYWMPIDWTGVGIHDAYWQPYFGGTNYLVRGSHGCLNTPYNACKEIFDNLEVGTPVIIYKS